MHLFGLYLSCFFFLHFLWFCRMGIGDRIGWGMGGIYGVCFLGF
jgi:hypothetical protein